MASKAASKRLGKEYVAMQKEPPPFIWAAPEEKNILTWHYIVRGPPDSPYTGGEYHGVLLFPSEYPFKPPGIKMFTPSGRFQCDKRICMSMSDFHPGSWNPAWSVATILTGLLSFMLSEEMTTGGTSASEAERKTLAAQSHAWNIQQRRFKDNFPDYCTATARNVPNMGERDRGGAAEETEAKVTPPTVASLAADSSSHPHSSRPTAAPATSSSNNDAVAARGTGASSLAGSWTRVVWEKWRWGVFIVLALVISRFTSA